MQQNVTSLTLNGLEFKQIIINGYSFKDYFVNENGEVCSYKFGKYKKLAPWILPLGYHRYGLKITATKRVNLFAHILVNTMFNGPKPFEKAVTLHNDGNPRNNHKSNLRWGTLQDNSDDCKKHGRRAEGERQGHALMTADDVVKIRELRKTMSSKEIAAMYNVSDGCIQGIVARRNWKHVL